MNKLFTKKSKVTETEVESLDDAEISVYDNLPKSKTQQKQTTLYETQNTILPLGKQDETLRKHDSFTRPGFFQRILGCSNASVDIDSHQFVDDAKEK